MGGSKLWAPVRAARLFTLAAPLLLASCLTVGTPPAGHPVEARDDRGTVFGHIAVRSREDTVPPLNPGADWASVGPGLRAELRVQLLRLSPRQVVVPPVLDDGLFCWQLPPGDYLLVGMPADDLSAEPFAQHQWPLAALRVPADPGVTCAGDLLVETNLGAIVLRGSPQVDFGIQGVEVTDACVLRRGQIEAHFAPLAAPARTALMVGAADLDFADPGLLPALRARLDAGAAP